MPRYSSWWPSVPSVLPELSASNARRASAAIPDAWYESATHPPPPANARARSVRWRRRRVGAGWSGGRACEVLLGLGEGRLLLRRVLVGRPPPLRPLPPGRHRRSTSPAGSTISAPPQPVAPPTALVPNLRGPGERKGRHWALEGGLRCGRSRRGREQYLCAICLDSGFARAKRFATWGGHLSRLLAGDDVEREIGWVVELPALRGPTSARACASGQARRGVAGLACAQRPFPVLFQNSRVELMGPVELVGAGAL